MKRLVLGAVVLLAACAPRYTEEKFAANLQTWVGSSEAKIIEKFGVPDSVYDADGLRYLAYKTREVVNYAGTPDRTRTDAIGSYSYTQTIRGVRGGSYEYYCDYQFRIIDKKVASFSYKGNDCTA